jgi:ribulose-phosphate 3-epimerase
MIIPAILETDFKAVAAKVFKLAGAEPLDHHHWLHLDVSDGRFTPSFTWQTPADLLDLPGDFKLEAHLMIERPETVFREWLGVVDRVIIHAEATDHWPELVGLAEAAGVELGVALLLETPLAVLQKLQPRPKFIQLMSIATIGKQGEKLAEAIFPRLQELRREFPDAIIQVDGGVNKDNLEQLEAAGAANLVSGSAYDSLRRQS